VNYLHTKEAKELYKALLSLKDEKEAAKFLGDLLTPAEIKEFANRWKVVQMLNAKVPYEKITKETSMSSTTIARIAKWMNGKLGGYKLMLERMKKQTRVAQHHSPFLAA